MSEKLLCRVRYEDGELVGPNAVVELLAGDELTRVKDAVAAAGGSVFEEWMVCVRYVDGPVRDVEAMERCISKIGSWSFQHNPETLQPLSPASAWELARQKFGEP